MMYTLWAYIIATIGMGCGIFVILKGYKWKIGTWIICISLSVFVGGKLQIENLVSNTFNITERLGGIESKIQELEVTVNQTVALKNEMSQTVNVITEVKKEIANINETIAQYYKKKIRERFIQEHLGKKVGVFDSGKYRVIYFQLRKIPIYNSVKVGNEKSIFSSLPFTPFRNIIIQRTNESIEKILTEENDFFLIEYVENEKESDTQLVTTEGMEYKGTIDKPGDASFQLLILDKESNAASQSSTNDSIHQAC